MFKQLYRGFFRGQSAPGKEKIPATKHINDESVLSYEDVKDARNVLGYLRDDVILVDFDTQKDVAAFERILSYLNIFVPTMKTNHGKHFYFKANENCTKALTKVIIACGLKADFKLGAKKGLDCIKFGGVWRDWLYLDAPLTPLPDWCRPLNEKPSSSGESLAELMEGSRNDTLFKYNGRLSRSGFHRERAQEIIRTLINPLVLQQPLDDQSILNVTRDEVYEQSEEFSSKSIYHFFTKNTFRQDLMAEYLIKEWHLVDLGDMTYFYDDGVYSPLTQRIFGKKIAAIFPTLTEARRSEVFKQVRCMTETLPLTEPDKYLRYIAFNNGIFDLLTGQLSEPSPDIFVLNRIPHNYNPDAYSALAEKFIKTFACNDPEIISSLYELIGHCFYRKNTIRGCFILLGNKRNGKSTFLETLSFILGDRNISMLKMQEIDERFKTVDLEGKLANIGDDISDEFIADTNKLKSAATSNPLTVERKGQDPYSIIPYATLIFSANDLPRLKDNTGAMLDRITMIPCKAYFDPSMPGFDPEMPLKLKTEEVAEFLICKGIEGLLRLLKNKKLTKGFSAAMLSKDYQVLNNPILGFLEDDNFGLAGNLAELANAPVDSVYAKFCAFSIEEGLQSLSKPVFIRKMKAAVGNLETTRTRLNFNRVRVFCKQFSDAPFELML